MVNIRKSKSCSMMVTACEGQTPLGVAAEATRYRIAHQETVCELHAAAPTLSWQWPRFAAGPVSRDF